MYQNMEKIKLIAFDMYDTCLHIREKSHPYKTLFEKLWLQEHRKELAHLLLTSPKDIQDILPPEAKEHKNFATIMEEFEWAIQKELASIIIYSDFFPIIDFLKKNGYQTAVLSNLAKPYAQALSQAQMQWIFDHTLLSFELGTKKPEKEIFQELQKKTWIKSEEILMVGDSLTSDVQWAKNASMQAIHLNRNMSWMKVGEDYTTISTLEELKYILLK